MKTKYLSLFLVCLFLAGNSAFAGPFKATITVINQGATPWGKTCSTAIYFNTEHFGCSGEDEGGSGGPSGWGVDSITNTYTYSFENLSGNIYGCPGSHAELWMTIADNPAVLIGQTTYYGGDVTEFFKTIYVNGDDCTVATNPCTWTPVIFLNDNVTNQIYARFTSSDGTDISSHNGWFTGPLVNYGPIGIENVPCSATVSVSYSNQAPCLEPLVFSVTSSGSTPRLIGVQQDGQAGLLGQGMISGTGNYFYSNNVPCGTAGSYHLYASDENGDTQLTDTGVTNQVGMSAGQDLGNGLTSAGGTGQNLNGGGNGSAPLVNNPSPSLVGTNPTFLPGVVPYTNALIWSSGTNNDFLEITSVAKESGQALFGAVVTAGQQAHSDASIFANQTWNDDTNRGTLEWENANGIIAAVNSASDKNDSDLGIIYGTLGTAGAIAHSDSGALLAAVKANTNAPAQVMTNYSLETTQTNVLGTLGSISNMLGGISNLLGASHSGGDSNALMMSMASAGTNDASAIVTAKFSTVLGYLDDVISAVGTPPDVGSDPGHSSDWEMDWLGIRCNFDPVSNFPDAFNLCYAITEFLLFAAYLISVGKLYLDAVKFFGTVQTGGVPDCEVVEGVMGATFGEFFGGNFTGIMVAVVVPTVLLSLWFAAITLIVTPFGSLLGIWGHLHNAFASVSATRSGAMATHVLFAAFPLGLFLQLLTARIILQFTMTKVMLVCAGAARYLFGK